MSEPGWYPDPANLSRLRFWDGAQWSQDVQGHPGPASDGPAQRRTGVPGWLLVIVGIVLVGLVAVLAIRVLGGGSGRTTPIGEDSNSSTPTVSGWGEGFPTPNPSSAAPVNCDPGVNQNATLVTSDDRLQVGPLSMPTPGPDWSGPSTEARMPLGSDGHMYQFPLPETLPWASSVSIGLLADPDYRDTRSSVRLISQCILTSGFYSTVDVTMDDYADKIITIDGVEAAQADFTVGFEHPDLTTKGSTLRLIVVDSSPRTWFFGVVPMEREDQIQLVDQISTGLQIA